MSARRLPRMRVSLYEEGGLRLLWYTERDPNPPREEWNEELRFRLGEEEVRLDVCWLALEEWVSLMFSSKEALTDGTVGWADLWQVLDNFWAGQQVVTAPSWTPSAEEQGDWQTECLVPVLFNDPGIVVRLLAELGQCLRGYLAGCGAFVEG